MAQANQRGRSEEHVHWRSTVCAFAQSAPPRRRLSRVHVSELAGRSPFSLPSVQATLLTALVLQPAGGRPNRGQRPA